MYILSQEHGKAAMKIAISAEGTDLGARVADRFGTSQYLVIVDLGSNDVEAVPNPGASGQRGAGVQAVVLAITKGVKAVLTGYCSPAMQRQLSASGIEVLAGLSGTIGEVVEKYRKGELKKGAGAEVEAGPRVTGIDKLAIAMLYCVKLYF